VLVFSVGAFEGGAEVKTMRSERSMPRSRIEIVGRKAF